jgi:NADPH:quinone reductase-like Zn-dependent oxidoreductase
MRTEQLNEFRSATNFKVVDIPIPEPKNNEILVKVGVAGGETES